MTHNYEELGFKAGLEVHQQLEGKKLFSASRTLNSDKKQDVSFSRKLRAVIGETGEIDVAAQHEARKEKSFEYVGDVDDTCLVDYDEEPPHLMDSGALETALKIALLLNAKIVDEVQVMRKTVIDGSNVGGFQRTALIARNGKIETKKGIVTIPLICLEEEACQKLSAKDKLVKYKLDRLGIPLIEIATDASIKDPEHAKEVAAHIGMVLRSVPGVKRGLGTIRQDVNVSIAKGERTEIKGFQDLKSIPKVVTNEIDRQLQAVKAGKKIAREVRKAEPDFSTSFLRPIPGAARLYPETDALPVRIEEEYVAKLEKNLPKLLAEQTASIENKYKISKDLSKELLQVEYFEELVKKFKKLEPKYIATVLVSYPKEIKKRYKVAVKLKKEDFAEVLGYLDAGKISKDAVIELLVKKAKKEKIDLKAFEGISEVDLEREVAALLKEKPNLNAGAYMGLLMQKHRGKVDGKKIMSVLQKHLK